MVTTRSGAANPEQCQATVGVGSPLQDDDVPMQEQTQPGLAAPLPQSRAEFLRPSSPFSSVSDSLVDPDVEDADIQEADIEDADMADADMEDASMEDAAMDDTDVEDSDMEDTAMEDSDTEEADALLDRIHSGIRYMQHQHQLGQPVQQTTRFQIDTSNPLSRPALTLLRRHATLIASAPSFELFELGIPRPAWVKEGELPGVHDPQWWVGKSQAEIKAGPFADEEGVRRAAAQLKGLETKLKKKKKGLSARERETEWKLSEGLRRQTEALALEDNDEEEDSVLEDEDEESTLRNEDEDEDDGKDEDEDDGEESGIEVSVPLREDEGEESGIEVNVPGQNREDKGEDEDEGEGSGIEVSVPYDEDDSEESGIEVNVPGQNRH